MVQVCLLSAQTNQELLPAKEYYETGEKLWEQRKFEAARQQFKQAIAADINFTPAHRSYIDLSFQMDVNLRAGLQQEYEAYLKTNPNNASNWCRSGLGQLYLNMNRPRRR